MYSDFPVIIELARLTPCFTWFLTCLPDLPNPLPPVFDAMLRHAQVLKQCLQRLCHYRANGPQFLPGSTGQPAQDVVSVIGDGQLHLPAVSSGTRPPYQATLFTAVYQLNHAVVIELHALRQSADDRLYLFGQSFNRQQHLVLLRIMPELAGVLLHVPQES